MDWNTLWMVLLVVSIALAVYGALRTSSRPKATHVPLPVLQPKPRCGDCRRFNLAAGQATLRRAGAFSQVMDALEPWEYLHPPHRVPHEGYDATQREIQAVQTRMNETPPGDRERGAELQRERDRLFAKLAELEREAIVKPGPGDVPEDDLSLKWSDFGHCGAHHELRVPYDSCEAFEAREPAVG